MFRNSQSLSRWVAAAVAATALAVPATSAADLDLRNPDNRTSGIEAQRKLPGYQDLRNPDAREPAHATEARAEVEPTTQPIIAAEPGFDWAAAGIGAGSALGLVLIVLAVMFAVVHRRARGAEA